MLVELVVAEVGLRFVQARLQALEFAPELQSGSVIRMINEGPTSRCESARTFWRSRKRLCDILFLNCLRSLCSAGSASDESAPGLSFMNVPGAAIGAEAAVARPNAKLEAGALGVKSMNSSNPSNRSTECRKPSSSKSGKLGNSPGWAEKGSCGRLSEDMTS